MKTSELELIMAYHDGELLPEQREQVELWLDTRPEARAYLDELEGVDGQYRQEMSALLELGAARPLAGVLGEASSPTQAKGNSGKLIRFPFRWPSTQAWAMAASLALMIALGGGWWMQFQANGDQPGFAQARNSALETTLSGEVFQNAEGAVQIMPLASYRTERQGLCREYAGRYESRQVSGLACREASGRWASVLEVTSGISPTADADTYVPASGPKDKVAKKLDALGAGQALTPEQEAQLITGQWR